MPGFTPVQTGSGQTLLMLGPSSTAVSGTLSAAAIACTDMLIYNPNGINIHVKWGTGAQTAVVNQDFIVFAGSSILVNKPIGADTVSFVPSTATSSTCFIVCGYQGRA